MLSYADGTSEEVPFVWVSAPIDAGFFVLYPANRPAKLTLYDSRGEVIARESIGGMDPLAMPETVMRSLPGYPHLSVPAEAIWEKRRQLFDLRADDGARVGLWVAPRAAAVPAYGAARGADATLLGTRRDPVSTP